MATVRATLTREATIPKDATPMFDTESSAVVYLYEKNGPCVAAFSGNKTKGPRYRFISNAKREAWVAEWFAGIRKQEERKNMVKAPHTVEVGDIMVCSWGYEQTNVDWYQVVGKKGKATVLLQRINGTREYTQSMAGTSMPVKDSFVGEEVLEKRVKSPYNAVKMSSYSTAFKWDGSPRFFSEWA